MDVSWDQYKPILRRAFFGDSDASLAPKDSEIADDFWTFFKKYLLVVARKKLRVDREIYEDVECIRNRLGIPEGPVRKVYRSSTIVHLDKTAKYMLRELPNYVIREFEYIIHCYLEFCQKSKLGKLKKLRSCQVNLPIATKRNEIIDLLSKNKVLIIAGDTGCGKSTQVPQYLLAADYQLIACTQPRRIACISLAKRVAFETLNEYGSRIAYQIRFERTKTQATRMLFLTEGLLLRQMAADDRLEHYNVIILDEIHERHLQGDFLMGLLRDLVSRRDDLKLILMSATINLELFSKYFAHAPVIKVPGRLFPIELKYLPPSDVRSVDDIHKIKVDKIDPTPFVRILQMIDKKYDARQRGDVLIFLSGISEISTVADSLKIYAEQTSRWIILMLHSTLSLEEQDKVFDMAPDGVRKCVLSTNIAETSVTIDGIRFVVDSGKVKQMNYDAATHMHQLKETWVSQASAEQRKGRAGRTGPGVCYRLYSQQQYQTADKYTVSEIRRVSLESLALQMYHLNFTEEPRKFPFIEPPDSDALEEAIESLKDQRALKMVMNNEGVLKDELTALGKLLVKLPVDVAIGKMLVMGCLFKQMEVVLTVAASMSIQSPFTNRSFRDLECLTLRRNLLSDHGDPFSVIRTFREWLLVKADSSEVSRKWCRHRGLEEQRLYEMAKLRRQFKELLQDADLVEKRSMIEISGTFGGVERRIRAGETQKLRSLKRKARHEQRKPKVLKRDRHFDSIMDEVDEQMEQREQQEVKSTRTDDVHSLEFSLAHSANQLNDQLTSHKLNHELAILIKTVLGSGLYPQYALLDQHNSYKIGTDQIVHTHSKPSAVLHPNGCLAQDPDVLAITLDKRGQSANHQLILYGLLLETSKPYLCNSFRVPALHFLLLFARQVQSSSDFSRIICDNFVEFTLIDTDKSAHLLCTAVDLRKLLAECLERKLDGDSYHSSKLSKRLLDYYGTEIVYSIKRRPGSSDRTNKRSIPSTVNDGFDIGGVPSSADSLEAASLYIATKWACTQCLQEFYSAPEEKLEHIRQCQPEKTDEEEEKYAEKSPKSDGNPLKRDYFCPECQCHMLLTSVEILKHRRTHPLP